MTAKLIREEARHTRTFVYAVHDKPRQKHSGGYHEIQPRLVTVILDRDKENEPWEISWATMTGPRILTNDKVGVREETQNYTCHNGAVVDPEAPEWFVERVAKTYALAERERTSLPVALPSPIDQDAIELGLRLTTCAKCPAKMDEWHADDNPTTVYAWYEEHANATGHRTFHVWRVSRNDARVMHLPA